MLLRDNNIELDESHPENSLEENTDSLSFGFSISYQTMIDRKKARCMLKLYFAVKHTFHKIMMSITNGSSYDFYFEEAYNAYIKMFYFFIFYS